MMQGRTNQQQKFVVMQDNPIRRRVSFVEAVKGRGRQVEPDGMKNNNPGSDQALRNRQTHEWRGLEFHIEEEEMNWLKGCYVAKTREDNGVFYVQQKMNKEEWDSIVATPLGGSVVLLSGVNEESVINFVQ